MMRATDDATTTDGRDAAPHVPDAHTLRMIAVHARCDPRSVSAYFRGVPQSSLVRQRIVDALAQLERQRRRGGAFTESNGAR